MTEKTHYNLGLLQWLLPDFPTENPLLNGMFCYICNGLVLCNAADSKPQNVVSNMKKIPLILIILTFFGCNQKEKNLNLAKTETKTQLTEKSETIFWIDTISNGKFLKIYSKHEEELQNLTAEYGNENKKHKIDLRTEKYQMHGIPVRNQIEWITEKSMAFIYFS